MHDTVQHLLFETNNDSSIMIVGLHDYYMGGWMDDDDTICCGMEYHLLTSTCW
jgi:hypothetical protein